jgi:hypothetical protein
MLKLQDWGLSCVLLRMEKDRVLCLSCCQPNHTWRPGQLGCSVGWYTWMGVLDIRVSAGEKKNSSSKMFSFFTSLSPSINDCQISNVLPLSVGCIFYVLILGK